MATQQRIEIAGTDLVFRAVPFNDNTPSGAQLAHAAGFAPDDFVYVLHLRDDGQVEDVRSVESVSLDEGRRFVVAESDGSRRFAMNGLAIDWPSRFITAATLRKVTNVAAGKVIYLELKDQPDRLLAEDDIVDLDEPGIEKFREGKGDRPKEQNIQVKHLGELETAVFRTPETATLQQIWDRAYVELDVTRDERDIFQAEVRGQPVSLMDHLGLTLVEAQDRDLCRKKFEIAARTGGA